MFDVFDCFSHKFICVSIIYFLNNQSLVSSVANTFGGGQKEKKKQRYMFYQWDWISHWPTDQVQWTEHENWRRQTNEWASKVLSPQIIFA